MRAQLESLGFGICLSVELGTVVVSLDSLVDAEVGSLWEFNAPSGKLLTIRSGGVNVAKAMLVREEGRYFLQITELCEEEPLIEETFTPEVRLQTQNATESNQRNVVSRAGVVTPLFDSNRREDTQPKGTA